MPGVSWNDREPTDWLASNGRWYGQSKHPRGWSTSALPPAPGHGGVGEILRRFVGTASPDIAAVAPSQFSVDDGSDSPAGWTVGSSVPTPPPASPTTTTRSPGAAVVPTGRRVADATITDRSAEFPPAAQSLPAAPGRLGAVSTPAPPMPAPPKKQNTPYIPPPTPAQQSASFDVVAGDFGKVLGSAKRRIEKAINESAQS